MNRIEQLAGKIIEETVERESNTFNARLNIHDLKRFADRILEEVTDVICECDPSPKMILHEPYRTVDCAITDHFYDEEVEE